MDLALDRLEQGAILNLRDRLKEIAEATLDRMVAILHHHHHHRLRDLGREENNRSALSVTMVGVLVGRMSMVSYVRDKLDDLMIEIINWF